MIIDLWESVNNIEARVRKRKLTLTLGPEEDEQSLDKEMNRRLFV